MANFTESNILLVIVRSCQSKRYVCKMFLPMNSRQEKSKFVQDFPASTSETVIFVGFQFHMSVVFYFVFPVEMYNKSVLFLFWRFFLGVLRTRQIKFAWCRSPNKRNYVFVGDELSLMTTVSFNCSAKLLWLFHSCVTWTENVYYLCTFVHFLTIFARGKVIQM